MPEQGRAAGELHLVLMQAQGRGELAGAGRLGGAGELVAPW